VSTRFYCPDPPCEGRLRLGADEARHLNRVCRLGVGDSVEVFDGRGLAMRSEVVATGADWVELIIAGPPLPERPFPFALTLATAVPKGDRFDWLVEKATELGVDRLIPIVTERSVVEPGMSKLSRLRKSIIEASKQSGRNRLMVLESPLRWEPLIDACDESMKFIADPEGRPARLASAIPRGGSVILAVGPEGGFTPSEKDLALRAHWSSICLSANTLRIETAALAGCAIVFSRMQESTE
jgi:16S rRNA (uracil1498-N3)-methyltransferase